ncbi:MAG: hypothetical protein MUW56_01950 [Chryseobacterium sp.]|uniref:hypothetical protein n=1 Tax=Chryseobacterium sp. TaxID=1871047 RepID=UPI0025C56B67|nr:hypothetical protein [Chryseobacterium sp.]MCJ7932415.1 hypothetical protein [Chryseobacterium sp.]
MLLAPPVNTHNFTGDTSLDLKIVSYKPVWVFVFPTDQKYLKTVYETLCSRAFILKKQHVLVNPLVLFPVKRVLKNIKNI